MFGCLSFMPNSPSRRNRSMYGLRLLPRLGVRCPSGLLKLLRSTFTAYILPVVAVHGAKHAGKRAGADAIQHLVVAVEEAGPRLGLHQPFELILRQQLAAQQSLLKRAERRVRRAQLAPHAIAAAHRRRRSRPARAGPIVPRF